MTRYQTSKKSLAAYKGHYSIVLNSFASLLTVTPSRPIEDAVDELYMEVQDGIEKLFNGSLALLETARCEIRY